MPVPAVDRPPEPSGSAATGSGSASPNGSATTDDAARAAAGLVRTTRGRLLWLVVCAAVLAVTCLASIAIGAKYIPLDEVVRALFDSGDANNQVIVGDMRVNRTLLGVICGIALGLAGALMQALTRNPLADPGILGVNAGAAFAVVLGVTLFGSMSLYGYIWFAFGGAALASVVVYALASLGRGQASPVRLALSGIALAAVLLGFTQAMVIMDPEVLDVYRFWQVGSLAGRDVETVGSVLPFIVVGVLLALGLARTLDAMALGDDTAAALGVNVLLARVIGVLAVTLLCGAATAAMGPVAFVGLIVPHIVRAFTGPDQRWILPFCLVVSPILLLVSDIVGRVVLSTGELQVGIVTTVIGGPVLIALVRRKQMVAS
ncbi:FecCD family ABC transporter permease [Jiangella alba]|uniref:Iron complex transport system permease protein n=1 Tax=Jiangella alba TaxID=561176 RepID=A0A1H5PIR2_9ACTN|nr:iron chelate uptake ABC transporter family permease subunit [Jiangella alba]SEF12941.1 iron complex transport system permease protein [Jiangella alba]